MPHISEALRGDEDDSAVDEKCSTFFDVYGPQVMFPSFCFYINVESECFSSSYIDTDGFIFSSFSK